MALHPGVPDWFNLTLDRLQAKAWSRALRHCGLRTGARVLDVGCGTGRWIERLERTGARPIGTERTEAMLRVARKRLRGSALVVAEAQRLPFADASFDGVLAVTVIQHVPRSEQAKALAEVARVARSGAPVVLLDLIRGPDLHVFPRLPGEWMRMGARAGIEPITWFGQEFLFFDRILRYLTLAFRRLSGGSSAAQLPALHSATTSTLTRRLYWTVRRLAVALSAAVEPFAERFFPQNLATHGVFIYRKRAKGA